MKTIHFILSLMVLAGFTAVTTQANEPLTLRHYQITIENLSQGQALTPPLLVSHTEDIQLYQVGQAADSTIQAIAENGDLAPLMASLEKSLYVSDMVISETGPLVPPSNPAGTDFSNAVTLTMHADHNARYLSFISMLICSNDGFTGLNSIMLPQRGSRVLFVSGYDAGTEINTEDFADLVPPCQGLLGVSSDDAGTGTSNPALAEDGVIHYHMGIRGDNDLLTDVHGWDNPLAKITITRIDEMANRFVAPLSGAGEVNPTWPHAQGILEVKIDWEHRALRYALTVHGLSGVTQAHIHLGSPSENGPPVASLYGPAPASDLVEGSLAQGMILEADLINAFANDFMGCVDALRQGDLYINVHTADLPAGAIRGQLGSDVRQTHGPRR